MATGHSETERPGVIAVLARSGYVAKGVIYTTVGVLSTAAIFDWFGVYSVTGTRGAVATIASQPFGNILLVLLIAGFAAYAIWRVIQGVADTEGKGRSARGWMQRAGYILNALTYLGLAWYAMTLSGWFNVQSLEREADTMDVTASLMQSFSGVLVVGLVGVGLVVSGLTQGYRAITKGFQSDWRTRELSAPATRFAARLSQYGIGVQAITFMIIGAMIIQAAIDTDSSQSHGLPEAFRAISEQPFGRFLQIVAATGLLSYGLFCFIDSRYRALGIKDAES